MYEFAISLSGDHIDAKAFLGAVANAVKLLRALDRDKAIRWRLHTLRYSSPATVGFVGEGRSDDRQAGPEEICKLVLSGLAALENGEIPVAFTEEALEISKKIAEVRGRGGVDGVAVFAQNGATPVTVPVTQRTAATVDEAIGAKYTSYGSITGRLEVISAHGGLLRCNIYERVLGRAVRCDIPGERRKDVLDLFDRDVVASGTIKRDAAGRPRHIELDSISARDVGVDLPQSLAGIAPDFTGDEDTVAYLRNRWQ